MQEAAIKPPSKTLLMMEMRALPELFGFSLSWPTLATVSPRGDGQPVLVLPGLITSDRSTEDLSLAELDEIISYVASFADYYDNILSEQFGAEMLGEE